MTPFQIERKTLAICAAVFFGLVLSGILLTVILEIVR